MNSLVYGPHVPLIMSHYCCHALTPFDTRVMNLCYALFASSFIDVYLVELLYYLSQLV